MEITNGGSNYDCFRLILYVLSTNTLLEQTYNTKSRGKLDESLIDVIDVASPAMHATRYDAITLDGGYNE